MVETWQLVRLSRAPYPTVARRRWWGYGDTLSLLDRTQLDIGNPAFVSVNQAGWNADINQLTPFNVAVTAITAPYGR